MTQDPEGYVQRHRETRRPPEEATKPEPQVEWITTIIGPGDIEVEIGTIPIPKKTNKDTTAE